MSGKQHECLPYVIAIVSALSVGDPFPHEEALNGDNDDENSNGSMDYDELRDIASEKIKAKEVGRLRRRSFFESRQVSRSYASLWLN